MNEQKINKKTLIKSHEYNMKVCLIINQNNALECENERFNNFRSRMEQNIYENNYKLRRDFKRNCWF